jgi:tetratricopeptide (TPR) repeat protein
MCKTANPIISGGIVHAVKGDLAAAVRDFDSSVQISPNHSPCPYVYRGLARANLGQLDQAIGDLTKAVTLDRRMRAAYKYRADVHAQKGDLVGSAQDRKTARSPAESELEHQFEARNTDREMDDRNDQP